MTGLLQPSIRAVPSAGVPGDTQCLGRAAARRQVPAVRSSRAPCCDARHVQDISKQPPPPTALPQLGGAANPRRFPALLPRCVPALLCFQRNPDEISREAKGRSFAAGGRRWKCLPRPPAPPARELFVSAPRLSSSLKEHMSQCTADAADNSARLGMLASLQNKAKKNKSPGH